MSEHEPPTGVTAGPVTLDTGLEAFESSQEFGGPVEDLDGHGCNDHFAQIYETPAEKFEAAVPFVRHGLDRGEQVAYVVDQSTEDEVRMRLQDAGIDVETALDLGALVFYTADDTYLRDESFDPDEMIQFYADATAEATEEYEALRLVAEMSWIEHDDTAAEELMEYESKINDLFDHEDVLAICQYDRELFAPEVINNIVRTHPHLIYDGAACHNFYYTPPEELFAEDNLARENERMLRTLHDRTTAKAELQQHDRFLRECYEITSDPGRSFDEKLYALFDLGRERFGLENGYFNRVDPDADAFEVVTAVGPHDMIEPGAVDALSGTFCERHLDSTEPLAAEDVRDAGLDYLRAHDEYGLEAYFAATVHGGSEEYGTLCFASETPRDEPFTEAERTFLDLMGQCVSYELERNHREAQLERKSDRLESFASLLAHELRNPVTIGQIYSQQLPADADAEAVEYVAEAFDRIEDMVDVLLILTRGREAIGERTPVDLARVARKAWDTVESPDAVLDIELDRTIEADQTYVRHLFRNLLENAVEHGGSDATIRVGDLDDVSASREGRGPSDHSSEQSPREDEASGGSEDEHGESSGGFYVADDGAGIPPEDRNAVFDEGYTTAADNGGTGLGLAFVQKLAEVYEWDLAVTDSADGGARFEFRNLR